MAKPVHATIDNRFLDRLSDRPPKQPDAAWLNWLANVRRARREQKGK